MQSSPALSRRQALAASTAALAGSSLASGRLAADSQVPKRAVGKAKSVILLYLHGGAPSQDMFDMKPAGPVESRGEFKPISTNVPGIDICEHLPRMARWMDRAALLRAVQHRAGCHNEIPSFTGYESPTGMQELNDQHLPPSMGSVCEYLKSPTERLPAYVSLPNPLGYLGETGPGAGFLGHRYSPLLTTAHPEFDAGADLKSRPNPVKVRGIPRINDSRLIDGMTLDRLRSRRSLLSQLDVTPARQSADGLKFDQFQRWGFDVLTSHQLQSCFDPALFDQSVKERYGNTLFGNSAFIASKLVQQGVKFVNVIWTWYFQLIGGLQDFGWDTHEHNFSILRHYLPQVDLVYSSLMEDLERTGLLDETLVVLTSDFGRTPNVNQTAGRDHWMHCYSTLLAGAGIRGGTVFGSSDKQAAWPVDGPVRPADICATIYDCLGIDPDLTILDRLNRPHKIAQGGEPIQAILA
ncbi:MAG: hypothetical protein JWM11_5839 [Planctomycetaceae bacterium]|nr:hypothetical protein [Planctomycetaceae bacterium]